MSFVPFPLRLARSGFQLLVALSHRILGEVHGVGAKDGLLDALEVEIPGKQGVGKLAFANASQAFHTLLQGQGGDWIDCL